MGLYGPRVSAAQSWGGVAGAAGLPDHPGGGPAQPPCRHAAGPEEEDLRQREPGPPGFCTQLPEKDVHAQHHTWLRGHLRGGLQHPRGKARGKKSVMSCFAQQQGELLNTIFVWSHQDAPGSEDREMLANLAASAHSNQSPDEEAAIEKYLRSVLSLENILTLDRLRQVGGDAGKI